ncbi:MAG TPA: hypothetical protein VKG05_01955 [Steroidobacteraceae bacterium]|nr:hypothetical protein [Steroidobacteraceae bacterium]
MQNSSIAAIGATLLIAGASEHAALSTNAAAYLQTITNTADWTLRELPAASDNDGLPSADSTAATDLGQPAGTPTWLDQLNIIGLALRAG